MELIGKVPVAGQTIGGTATSTGGCTKCKELDLGPVMIRKPGEYELVIQPVKMARSALMNLKAVRLVPE